MHLTLNSVRCVSELQALMDKEQFLFFHRDRVTLKTSHSFMPKLVSELSLNQAFHPPVFFPNPQSKGKRIRNALDVHRQLRYYFDRTNFLKSSDQLLAVFA